MNKQSDSDSDTLQSSSATSSRTFRIPTHSENILAMLNKQRETGEYCDVTVLVEHQRFSAHKCILAANSPYLQSLMAGNSDGVLLRQITPSSFKSIIDFMYTSKLQLLSVTVQDILNAAKLLQIRSVVSICCRYLESQLMHIAKDVTSTKGKGNSYHSKPIAVAVDTKYSSPRQFGQSVASSSMVPQQNGPFYNGNVPQMAPAVFNSGRQSVLPQFLPHDYDKLPPPNQQQSPTKRYEFTPHQQTYRPYHNGRQAYNPKPTDQQSMYGQPNGSRNDFMTPQQQPWLNPGFQRNNHPNPVSNGNKKSSSARDSTVGRDKIPPRNTFSDTGNRGQMLSPSCNGHLPRVNSGQSHFTIEPEDRYFHKKYSSDNRRKSDDDVAFVREFKNNLPLKNSPKSDDHFSNVSYY